jgi:hypothetical protein
LRRPGERQSETRGGGGEIPLNLNDPASGQAQFASTIAETPLESMRIIVYM